MTTLQSLDFFPDSCIISADGKPDNFGYPRLSATKGRYIRSHRIAYRLFKGKIPQGSVIMHTCDNPKCVNPKHLIAGTHSDNYADMRNKERYCRGEGVWQAKLTETAVKEILNSSNSVPELATKYSVTRSTIYAVIKRRTWKHVSVEGI